MLVQTLHVHGLSHDLSHDYRIIRVTRVIIKLKVVLSKQTKMGNGEKL